MPPYPDMNDSMVVENNGRSMDDSIEIGKGVELEQATNSTMDTRSTTPLKQPWYRRRNVLYCIAITVALTSIGLAVFAILWATDVISITGGDAASVSSGTSGGTTPATDRPIELDNPSPPPQEVLPAEPTEPEQAPLPTANPTALATQAQRTDPLKFYAMGDVPYADWEEIMLGTQLGEMSASLPPGAEFVVHVGDMQKAQRTNCDLGHFYKIANILGTGPLPTFVHVGDNDYLDCPDPGTAFNNYKSAFVGFEGNWTHSLNVERWTTPELVPMEYDVTRMVANPEMWAFLEDGILFIGFNLLNMNLDQGELPDDLFYERLADSKHWVIKQLNEKKGLGIRGTVMFSHAMVSPDIRPFFEDLKDVFTNAGVYSPVLYIHGDGHDFKINTQLGLNLGWPQLTRVEVDQGGYADPLLITVAPNLGGIAQNLVADDSGLQFAISGGLFLVDRQNGRYPDSVNPNN